MTAVAISTESLTIYYSSIVIALSVAACFLLTYALFVGGGGRPAAMLLYMPVAIIISVFLSRAIHWYCHPEQYADFITAVTVYGTGDFVLSGALVGTFLAALLVRLTGLCRNTSYLLDCTAPGAVIAIAGIRLSCLFNTSCISKIAIKNERFMKLPFGYPFTDAAGNIEYRFATFFVEFLVLLVLFAGLLFFFAKHARLPKGGRDSDSGSTAWMFLIWYGMIELVMDSTRYDSSFAHFNGFVSIVQMVCAISMILALVIFSIRACRISRAGLSHWLVWIGFLLALGATGVSEYMVQRHGDWYRICYATMTVGCFFMAFTVCRMYRLQRGDRT